MRVSIITPSKNQGRFIKQCLRTIHEQTHQDIEHIVLDGMSTDETAEIVAGYPCTFLQRKDSGPAQAINRGLEMATGEIVCWLNADDEFWSNRTLERVVELFSELPEVDMVSGNGYYIGESGGLIHPIVPQRPWRFAPKWIARGDFILQPATFWRRNQIRLDESLKWTFDWQFWIDSFNKGLNVLYVPEYFAKYRLHSTSLTQLNTAAQRAEMYRTAKRNNQDKLVRAWFWTAWRAFQLSELLHLPVLKELAGRWVGC